VELVFAFIYFITGKTVDKMLGKGIAALSMALVLTIFTIFLIIYFRQHTYGQDKPLLTALSIYYKSLAYVVVLFYICNFSGKDTTMLVAMISLILYGVLSYIHGKKYNEMLNAYLYFLFITNAMIVCI
jgi:predicted membrane protein